MRVCVLIPSEEYRNLAGARIRYGRINALFQTAGHVLQLEDINLFDPLQSAYDIHIISKCHDAQSLICAHALKGRGKLIGVDLFDDYFSQHADSRFARFRIWLAELLGVVDFALCSTPAMANVAGHYRSDVPIHVMNDPAEDLRANEIAGIVEQKLNQAQESRSLKFAWFGVGDNANFQIGLSDLAAFGNILAGLRSANWNIALTVLTNKRAMTGNGLAQLRRLSIPFSIEEWSEEREQSVLDESLACFLPVNAQNFSMAKSLNRAISALTSGCQVLSAGYPLYQRLSQLIYTDIETFADDLAYGRLRLSAASADEYIILLSSLASKDTEAAALIDFFQQLLVREVASERLIATPVALLHGSTANGASHKMAKRVEGLSIGGPFCAARLPFDALFRYSDKGEITLLVAEKALKRLIPEEMKRTVRYGDVADQTYWTLGSAEIDASSVTSLSHQLSSYATTASVMVEKIQSAFGAAKVIFSETSTLPMRDLDDLKIATAW